MFLVFWWLIPYSMLFLIPKQFLLVAGMTSPGEWRLKLDFLASTSFKRRYVHALTFPPFRCSFLIRQQHKGRSQRNGIACLPFKIKADRYNGIKEKHVHKDVVIDFRELVMALLMQLKIGLCMGVGFVCLLFDFCFCLYTKMASSKYFSLKWTSRLSYPCQSLKASSVSCFISSGQKYNML